MGPQDGTSWVGVWTFVIFLDHGGYKSDLWLGLEAMAGGGWAGGQTGRRAGQWSVSLTVFVLAYGAGPGPAIVLGITLAPQGPNAAGRDDVSRSRLEGPLASHVFSWLQS